MPVLDYAESGAGRPVVLLHAFPLSRQMWQFQHDELSGLHLITPDLTGFGGSQASDAPPGVGVMADGVISLLDELGLPGQDDVVLGGLSMGGYVVMEILRRRPGLASALILADTKAGADPDEARNNRLRMAAVLETETHGRPLVEEVLPNLVGETTQHQRPDLLALVRHIIESVDPRSAAWAQRAMAGRPDSFDILRGADLPALVLVGEEDVLSPPDDARAMAEALPNSRLVTIPSAGHLTAVESPTAFNHAVRGFVHGLAP